MVIQRPPRRRPVIPTAALALAISPLLCTSSVICSTRVIPPDNCFRISLSKPCGPTSLRISRGGAIAAAPGFPSTSIGNSTFGSALRHGIRGSAPETPRRRRERGLVIILIRPTQQAAAQCLNRPPHACFDTVVLPQPLDRSSATRSPLLKFNETSLTAVTDLIHHLRRSWTPGQPPRTASAGRCRVRSLASGIGCRSNAGEYISGRRGLVRHKVLHVHVFRLQRIFLRKAALLRHPLDQAAPSPASDDPMPG